MRGHAQNNQRPSVLRSWKVLRPHDWNADDQLRQSINHAANAWNHPQRRQPLLKSTLHETAQRPSHAYAGPRRANPQACQIKINKIRIKKHLPILNDPSRWQETRRINNGHSQHSVNEMTVFLFLPICTLIFPPWFISLHLIVNRLNYLKVL